MADLAASSKRICGTYRREDVDHVPIMSPIGWGPQQDIDSESFDDWRDEENFRKVARLVERHCDFSKTYSPAEFPAVFEPIGYQRFLEAPAEHVEALPPEKLSETRTRQTTLLHALGGDLKWVYDEDQGVFTKWDMHKPIQCAEDIEKMLGVPYEFKPPDAAGFEAFRKQRAAMGENALGGAGVNSMVAMLCGMMDYELLLEWVLTEPALVKSLADEWLKRVGEKVDFLLAQGVGPFWHFNGVERACPPLMGPRQWEDLVVPYDGEIMRRIKAANPENRIHVHCHGRVAGFLDSWVEMGVDSIDPTEPPPQGDAELADIKERYAGRLVFYGNIEFLDMETGTPDEVEELVRQAIEGGGRGNLILMPSSGPHERPSDQFTANAIRYIEAGVKYGQN